MDTKEKERRSKAAPSSAGTRTRHPSEQMPERRPGKSRHKAEPKQEKVSPDVVYLPPQPLNRNRLILRLVTVVAVVLALVLGISVFFKVDNVEVSGTSKYTEWDIYQASGIEMGEYLLTFSRAQAASRIIAALPYVESVRIGIKLPGTVKIDIVEAKIPYAIQASDDSWWLITSSGKVMQKAQEGEEEGYTKLLGVCLDGPKPGEQAVAKEKEPAQDPEGNSIPVVVSQAKHLETALNIIDYLEQNGIIGKAANVNVEDLGNIQFWYEQRYQVKLGDDTQLLFKISCVKGIIDKMDNYKSGILDATFTSKPNSVGYKPFAEEQP